MERSNEDGRQGIIVGPSGPGWRTLFQQKEITQEYS